MLSDPADPQNQLPLIRQRKAQKDAVFPVSPLQGAHDRTNEWNKALKEKTGLEFGMNSNTLFQGLSSSLDSASCARAVAGARQPNKPTSMAEKTTNDLMMLIS